MWHGRMGMFTCHVQIMVSRSLQGVRYFFTVTYKVAHKPNQPTPPPPTFRNTQSMGFFSGKIDLWLQNSKFPAKKF